MERFAPPPHALPRRSPNRPLPGAAQPTVRFVDNDLRQPRAQARFAAKLGKPREGANVTFLNDIFGFAVIFHDAARETEKPAVVLPDDGTDGVLII